MKKAVIFWDQNKNFVELPEGETLIGRSEEAPIKSKIKEVSRKHAKLFWIEGQLSVLDLGSSNGTFVNQEVVDCERPLADGDQISIAGVLILTVRISDAEEDRDPSITQVDFDRPTSIG